MTRQDRQRQLQDFAGGRRLLSRKSQDRRPAELAEVAGEKSDGKDRAIASGYFILVASASPVVRLRARRMALARATARLGRFQCPMSE